MASCRTVNLGIVICLIVIAGSPAAAFDDYVMGESAAWLSHDAGFLGYWKYYLTVAWDVTGHPGGERGLSHLSFLLGLHDCPIACSEGYFAFPDTTGSSTMESGCTVYYYTEFNCKGDPTIPEPVPTIKFEPYPDACEPDISGTASVFFYSLAPPRLSSSQTSYVWIKFGGNIERGTIQGALPSCVTVPNAAEASTWSGIKSLYR